MAGHGGGLEVAFEFFDVAARLGDGGGKLFDDAGAVVAHDVEGEDASLGGVGGGFFEDVDFETGDGTSSEGAEESGGFVFGALDPEDAGEVSRELGHA